MRRTAHWPAIVSRLRAAYGTPPRDPPPLGNHIHPNDEAVYIQLTYMTRSQAAVEAAYADLRGLAPDGWCELSLVDPDRITAAVTPLGLTTRRTKNLQRLAGVLADEHDGDLSTLRDLDDRDLLSALMRLPGLGPKGARCVAAYSFGRDVLAVDVHVLRLAKRLGFLPGAMTWAHATTVLEDQVAPEIRFDAHVLLVQHGRSICSNKAPSCGECVLVDLCPSAFIASERRADYVPELRHGTNSARTGR